MFLQLEAERHLSALELVRYTAQDMLTTQPSRAK